MRQYVTQMEAVKFGIQLSRTAIGEKALEHAYLQDMAELVMFKNTAGLATMWMSSVEHLASQGREQLVQISYL